MQGREFSSAGRSIPPLPAQKYKIFILFEVSSQILLSLVKKMKSQILLVAFLIAENRHFSQTRGGA